MKYMGDSEWWNARFMSRELNVMIHEECLEDDIKYFPNKGKILDIACGDGRNAIYLARLGYEVIAIDFCEEALKRLSYFAQEESLKIKTQLIDLSKPDSLNNLNNFEGIIINHYRLKPELYINLMDSINQGGVLWINGFREVPSDNPNVTESDILQEKDFTFLHNYESGLKKIYEVSQRKFIRYIWIK